MSGSRDPWFMLIYAYSDDYLEKRTRYRKQHVQLAEELVEKGHIVLGGALEDPPDRAYICFQCPDRSVVEDFVERDPYVLNGLVRTHEIRDWKVVVGTACGNPISSRNL